MLTLGRRMAPREIERYIDMVTEEDIKRVAQAYLWDKDIAIAAVSTERRASRCRRGIMSLGVLM